MPTQRQWQIWDLEARAKVDKLVRQWQQDFKGNRGKRKSADKKQPPVAETNGRVKY